MLMDHLDKLKEWLSQLPMAERYLSDELTDKIRFDPGIYWSSPRTCIEEHGLSIISCIQVNLEPDDPYCDVGVIAVYDTNANPPLRRFDFRYYYQDEVDCMIC